MDLNRFHPTQKPVDIYSFMFKYCKIEENATLLDCFGGSGNIAIACDKEKLNLDICEIDETYYQKKQIILRNFQKTDAALLRLWLTPLYLHPTCTYILKNQNVLKVITY